MTQKTLTRLILLLWLSAALFLAIGTGSPSIGWGMLLLGAVFMAPALALEGLKSPTPVLRDVSRGVVVLSSLAFVLLASSMAERLFLVNAQTYPSWMTGGNLGEVGLQDLRRLRTEECGTEPIEIFHKADGDLLRCGYWWWQPSTRTWKAEAVHTGR